MTPIFTFIWTLGDTMKSIGTRSRAVTLAVCISAGAGLMAGSGTAAAGCVRAGGEATMVTRALAEFMAEAALKNSIAGMGATPAGPIKMVCTDDLATTHCIAKRRACK